MFSKAIIITGAMALMSVGAHAAGTDLAVEVTIAPEACSIALGDNGHVDYGDLSVETVKGYEDDGLFYILPSKRLGLDVQCASSVGVALSVSDNAQASRLPDTDNTAFGLGADEHGPFGILQVAARDVMLIPSVGNSPRPASWILVRPRGAATDAWRPVRIAHLPRIANGFLSSTHAIGYGVSWDATSPTPLVRLRTNLEIGAIVLRDRVVNATSALRMKGSLSFELEYT